MTSAEIEALFSRSPASFVFTDAPPDKGSRVGASAGATLEISDRAVTFVGVFAPDRPDMAARNGTLALLLLIALRPDWSGASVWLSGAMREVARAKLARVEVPYYSQRVWLVFNRQTSLGMLRVEMV